MIPTISLSSVLTGQGQYRHKHHIPIVPLWHNTLPYHVLFFFNFFSIMKPGIGFQPTWTLFKWPSHLLIYMLAFTPLLFLLYNLWLIFYVPLLCPCFTCFVTPLLFLNIFMTFKCITFQHVSLHTGLLTTHFQISFEHFLIIHVYHT